MDLQKIGRFLLSERYVFDIVWRLWLEIDRKIIREGRLCYFSLFFVYHIFVWEQGRLFLSISDFFIFIFI